MESVLFYIFGGVALVSAAFVVIQKKPIHSALFLVLTFFCLAGLFLLLGAEFIAAVQVIVYAGAIMVLFLFVIMLLNLEKEGEEDPPVRKKSQRWIGIFIAIMIFLLMIPVWSSHILSGLKGLYTPDKVSEVGNTVIVARTLFTKYLLPFEIASVLLLVAMIGGVILSKKRL
jgi:NADH-quinone oxidoreductase subunit J